MDIQWDISQPFEYVNEEDAQFHFPSKHLKPHQEYLHGWEATQSGAKVRLLEVVHGYHGGDTKRPRTLVVFEFILVSGTNKTRLENVKIVVGFRATGKRDGVRPGGNLSDWDPVPVKWAPEQPVLPSNFVLAQATEAKNAEHEAKMGYDPYLNLGTKRGKGSTLAVERVNYRYIASSPALFIKNSLPMNAMKWELVENQAIQGGVQYQVRTAVLLRRKNSDYGPFDIFIDIQANDSFADKLMRIVGKVIPHGSAGTFDPTVLPGSSDGEEGEDDVASRVTTRDWKNLETVNLQDVLIRDWGVASLEELAEKRTIAEEIGASEASS